MWRKPELVIFDCDGVLVDSETISNRVLADMLTAEDLPTTLTQSRREYQGMLLADIRARAEDALGRALPEDWLARYESERDAAFRRELAPHDGSGRGSAAASAPDVFLHAATSMGVAPAHCVVVEDTRSGVTAAVSARMRAVGYAADSDGHALRDAGATEILRSLDRLPRLLDLD